MAQRRALEVKVGLFIVSGVGLFVIFLFAIGDLATYFQPGYQVRVQFESANGITQGSPVQYAGLEVGKIQDVRIVQQSGSSVPEVELIIRIPTSVTVRSDDEASISTFGLLGEKFLEIEPGPGLGNALGANGVLVGKPPVSTEDIIERSNHVLTELQQTLGGINSLVGDPQARIFLKEAIQEARDATRQWRVLGERLNLAMLHVEAGQGSIGKFLYDDSLHRQVEQLIEDLRANPWKLLVRPKKEKP